MIEVNLFGRCLRRWYVLLLGVLLTAAAVANVNLLPGVVLGTRPRCFF